MTTDTINEASKPLQEGYDNLLKRIAVLDVDFIALKLDVRDWFNSPLQTASENVEGADTPKSAPVYEFAPGELGAIYQLLDVTAELLMVTQGITARIVKHTTMEESVEILTLQSDIQRLYSNYNYYLPNVKKFEDWVKVRALKEKQL